MSNAADHIDRYEVQEIIGRGAMGVVYRARDPLIGRIIALKTVNLPQGAGDTSICEAAVRFAREARAAGLLSHPNIVTVYDVGETEDSSTSYIAMELVEGRNLREIAPSGQAFPLEQLLEIAQQVARALDYAHARGVIHRDVKPANILVRDDGLVKLADFGVAVIESSDLTRTGHSVGSPSYLAPEMLGSAPVDGRADLFALGVILYEILAGRKPFLGETLAALYNQILSFTPPPPSRFVPDVPAEWDAVVTKLLAKNPDERYPGAAHLLEDLRCIELGRPLRFAPLLEEADEELAAVTETEELPEPIPDELLVSGTTSGRRPRGPLPPQVKALLALLTVAGFAIGVMTLSAVLREAPLGPAPVPSLATAGPPVPAPVPDATLTLRFDHTLKGGRIAMTIDGKPALTESFRGERSRLRTRGGLVRTLDVPQGEHVFQVMVASDDGRTWSETTIQDVGEGGGTLDAELRGLMSKDLRLSWR